MFVWALIAAALTCANAETCAPSFIQKAHTLTKHAGKGDDEEKAAALERLQKSWSNMPATSFQDTVSNSHLGIPAFTYTVAKNDADSEQPRLQGVLEPAISYHMVQDAKACCQNGGHFLDVGGNFGWYALLGAAMGCRTDTIEPVPWFADLVEYNKDYNNPHLSSLITLHRGMVVGDKVGVQRTIAVPHAGILGTASIDGAAGVSQDRESLKVQEMTVDSFNFNLDRAPCVMKVDVEGFEPYVFNGSLSYLDKHPLIIAIELSPGYTKKWDSTNTLLLQMLETIIGAGYMPHLLGWNEVKSKDWAQVQADISTYSYTGRPRSLIEQCGFNCMVYFKRQG